MMNGYFKEVTAVDPASHYLFVNVWSSDLERLHAGDLRWPPVVLPDPAWTGFDEILLWETDHNRVEVKLNLRGWQRLGEGLNAWIPQVVAIEELLEPITISLSLEADANDLVNGAPDRISFLPLLEARAIPERLFVWREQTIAAVEARGEMFDRSRKLDSGYYTEVLRTLMRQHDSVRQLDNWLETMRAIAETFSTKTVPQFLCGSDLRALIERGLAQGYVTSRDVDQLRLPALSQHHHH